MNNRNSDNLFEFFIQISYNFITLCQRVKKISSIQTSYKGNCIKHKVLNIFQLSKYWLVEDPRMRSRVLLTTNYTSERVNICRGEALLRSWIPRQAFPTLEL